MPTVHKSTHNNNTNDNYTIPVRRLGVSTCLLDTTLLALAIQHADVEGAFQPLVDSLTRTALSHMVLKVPWFYGAAP
jgi:hypothetical protein